MTVVSFGVRPRRMRMPPRLPDLALLAGGSLLVAGMAAGCAGGDPARPETPATFGPESLSVALTTAPDSVFPGAGLAVRVTVRNPSGRAVVAQLQCPAGGVVVGVLGADGTALRTSPAACPAELATVTVRTFAPGDSATTVDTLPLDVAAGAYRVEASFVATNGRARSAESRVVVRSGPRLCSAETVISVGPGPRHEIRWTPDCVVTSVGVLEVGAPAMEWVIRVPEPTLRSPQRYGVAPPGATAFGFAMPLRSGRRYHLLLGIRASGSDERTVASTIFVP